MISVDGDTSPKPDYTSAGRRSVWQQKNYEKDKLPAFTEAIKVLKHKTLAKKRSYLGKAGDYLLG